MAERTLTGACKKFSANVFHENKCQNCFKPKDVHQQELVSSPTSSSPPRPTSLEVTTAARQSHRTTVKSGTLRLATQISTLPDVRIQKWEQMLCVLYSSGDLEWSKNPTKVGQAVLGSINLDECIGLTSAEVDTNEPFTIGIKTPLKTHYLKAENRLEMDNWCRVLKPFVIASPGYNFSSKSAATRSLSIQDMKQNIAPGRKSSASRTMSAPWLSAAPNGTISKGISNTTNKRPSPSAGKENVMEDAVDGGRRRPQTRKQSETEPLIEKEERSPSLETAPQPYYTDKYLAPEPADKKLNGIDEAESNERDELEAQLVEAKRMAKHNESKAEICTKNLAETRKALDKSNNLVSIQKANITSLKSEIDGLESQMRNNEKSTKKLENGLMFTGSVPQGSVESGFLKLQAKLQENEEALIRRTQELGKANESRAKVAKHTRSLLLELESKLIGNNQRIAELEEQLLNRTLELQYEKDERKKIASEKGKLVHESISSKEHSKQREITKKSTELLQQAKQDHLQFKNVQKIELKHQEQISGLENQLQSRDREINRLKEKLPRYEGDLGEHYKSTQENLGRLQVELNSLTKSLAIKDDRCQELECNLKDSLVEIGLKESKLIELVSKNETLTVALEKMKKQHEQEIMLLQEDNERTRDKLQEVKDEVNSLRTETDEAYDSEIEGLKNDLEDWKAKLRGSQKEHAKLQKTQTETLESFNNEKNIRLKLERDLKRVEVNGLKAREVEIASVKEDLGGAREELRKEKVRVGQLEADLREMEDLNKKNEAYRTEICGVNEKLVKEYDVEKCKVVKLESVIKKMETFSNEKEASSSKAYMKELNSVKDELQRSEQELKAERLKITLLQEDLKKMEQVYSEKETKNNKSHEKKLSDVQNELRDTNKQLTFERTRLDEFQEEFVKLQQSHKQRQDEIIENKTILESRVRELENLKEKLSTSEEEVLSLGEALKKQWKVDEEAIAWVEDVGKNLSDTVDKSSVSKRAGYGELNILDAVKLLGAFITNLKDSVSQERSKLLVVEEELSRTVTPVVQEEVSTENELLDRKCNMCEEKDSECQILWRELEQARKDYGEELEKLKESKLSDEQGIKYQREEIKLKLSSKVILLQSDINELKTKHDEERLEANERFKKELDELRQAQDDLIPLSQEISRLTQKNQELAGTLQEERDEHTRKVNALKNDYATSSSGGGQQNGEITPELLAELQEKHAKEISALQERHQTELEGNKSDMMMVLQALKSDSYQSMSNNDALDENDQVAKHERYIETLKKDHEKEIGQLKEKHEQDLQQLRSDMVTLLRVQESYKSPGSGDDQTGSDSYPADLNRQLETMRQSYEREARDKEERHRLEIEQIKGDMLVAIQAASLVGGIVSPPPLPSNTRKQSSDNGLVQEQQEQIATMEKEFEMEREMLQNTVKKAESATKFGLRRNEEMSNKIYQMQREMEEIDAKYQKEIKLYKVAFDQQKTRKASTGALPEKDSDLESSLRVQVQELELNMEQMQVRYEAEIKRYKEKFQQEKVLTVEELQLKIKSLEDTIEQMRLEHANELERYTKAVKRGKVSLAGTVKERDLERKIDDLESKFEVMRQKHREEMRKYRERLEDEMGRHRKEVSEGKSKLRKLESDNRHVEDLRSKITEHENKATKLTKDLAKSKDLETQLNDTKAKNRELARQVESLKRKVEKFEGASEEPSPGDSLARNKLQRYTSCDNVTVAAAGKTKGDTSNSEEDSFETNNNNNKIEIGGYKLNPGLKRPASISSLPAQSGDSSVGVMRRTCSEKRRETSGRPYTAAYLKTSRS